MQRLNDIVYVFYIVYGFYCLLPLLLQLWAELKNPNCRPFFSKSV